MQEFHRQGAPQLYPASLSDAIEDINGWVYESISNGAYKAGFSSSQLAYEVAYEKFFESIDRLELILSGNRCRISIESARACTAITISGCNQGSLYLTY